MPEPTAAPRSSRPRRRGWIAWKIGWVLLVLVSMSVAYGVLVVGGR
jgi:hypothetical protein